jgi:hypothetical protein
MYRCILKLKEKEMVKKAIVRKRRRKKKKSDVGGGPIDAPSLQVLHTKVRNTRV